MAYSLDRVPVIVGVGDVIDRPDDLYKSKEPAVLMAEAAREAETDAGSDLLAQVDSVDIILQASCPYADLPARLCQLLAITPARAVIGDGSGNGPLRELHNAALRIAKGESEIALICGGEAQHSVNSAERAKVQLPWLPDGWRKDLFAPRYQVHTEVLRYGLATPLQVYPLYENAFLAALGQTPAEAEAESAAVWSAMSGIAARNPFAWIRRSYSPEEIVQPANGNRLLAWPYRKLMVAQPSVNMGAAILVTSYARARRAGVAEDRMVFILDGTSAREADDYLRRDRYDSVASQNAVLEGLPERLGPEVTRFDFVELYSCFPCVPKMARRILKLPADQALTVAGGLTFAGGPLHNYMSHALTAMTRRLRENVGATGLLYGQGGFVTKHHALAIRSGEAPRRTLSEDHSVQAKADLQRGPIPTIVVDYEGPSRLETFTIIYDRDSEPAYGAVIARTENGTRLVARVPSSDRDTLGLLTDKTKSPVGTRGRTKIGLTGWNEWAV